MLTSGQEIELAVERPAAGGRMIARHDGQVVLVSGAIPGERVVARVERNDKRLAFAATVAVVEASADRREAVPDPGCGGCAYSHITYPRQLALKADLVLDAFRRLGKVPLEAGPDVAGSTEHGYRMRARFHIDGERIGFYREGSHTVCDAVPTRQIREDSNDAVVQLVDVLRDVAVRVDSVELAENLDASERALVAKVESVGNRGALRHALEGVLRRPLVGCVVEDTGGASLAVGVPYVSDALADLSRGRAREGRLRRHAGSFFQANRFLVPDLVTAVIDAVPSDRPVTDLYAGVGLFAAALASCGVEAVTAVEGDRLSGADLVHNARACGPAVTAVVDSVERYVRSRSGRADTIIIDPPRTGLSAVAMLSIIGLNPSRLVYVSCDPATMARDARRLLDSGYRMDSLRAFDLFPNTPHVETLGVFLR